VRPGQVFKPMLSARNTSDFKDIVKRMGQFRLAVEEGEEMTLYPDDPDRFGLREFIIEEKLDGVRLQMHKSGDTYKYFSRQVHSSAHAL
jgi:DNA ligase-4